MTQEDALRWLRESSQQQTVKLDQVVAAVSDLKSSIGERVAVAERDVTAAHTRLDCAGDRIRELTESIHAEVDARQTAVTGAEKGTRAFVLKLIGLVVALVVLGLTIAAAVS